MINYPRVPFDGFSLSAILKNSGKPWKKQVRKCPTKNWLEYKRATDFRNSAMRTSFVASTDIFCFNYIASTKMKQRKASLLGAFLKCTQNGWFVEKPMNTNVGIAVISRPSMVYTTHLYPCMVIGMVYEVDDIAIATLVDQPSNHPSNPMNNHHFPMVKSH